MSVAEKLTTIAQNAPKVYAAGKTAARAKCTARHFASSFIGDGTQAASFHVPFAPDYITVFSFDRRAYQNGVILFLYDLRSLSPTSGHASAAYEGNRYSSAYASSGMANRYQQEEDGVVTVQNVNTSSSYGYASFCEDVVYYVLAMKYEDRTDAERLEELVGSLDDSGGTLQISKVKVNAAFTEAEWAALIAQKPNWTFTLM